MLSVFVSAGIYWFLLFYMVKNTTADEVIRCYAKLASGCINAGYHTIYICLFTVLNVTVSVLLENGGHNIL